MRKIFIIILVMVHFLCRDAHSLEPGFSLGLEYRNDVLDHTGVKRHFCRDEINVNFSGGSSLDFSHLYISEENENRYTWNLDLADISRHCRFLLGNYYVHFGTGLFIGKEKRFYEDIYETPLLVSREKAFAGCSSGNPVNAYRGAAAAFLAEFHGWNISLNPYYSIKDRYASMVKNQSRKTESSLQSISLKTEKNYNSSEPVTIHDTGVMMEIKGLNTFLLQAYFTHSEIRDENNRTVQWDYMDKGTATGISGYNGCGIFTQYRDDYVCLFFEAAFPFLSREYHSKKRSVLHDSAYVYGMKVRLSQFRVSFTGKKCGPDFYAPYSSNDSTPENSWMLALALKPGEPLLWGGSVSMEKKVIPSSPQYGMSRTLRERLYARWALPGKGFVKVIMNNYDSERRNGSESRVQVKTQASVPVCSALTLDLAGAIQKYGDTLSGSGGAGCAIAPHDAVTLKLHYSWYSVEGDNRIYSKVYASRNSLSPGLYIKETSSLVVACLAIKSAGINISARYHHQFVLSGTIDYGFDVSGMCVF